MYNNKKKKVLFKTKVHVQYKNVKIHTHLHNSRIGEWIQTKQD